MRVIPLVAEQATLVRLHYQRMGRPKVGLIFPSHCDPTRPVPNGNALHALHASGSHTYDPLQSKTGTGAV